MTKNTTYKNVLLVLKALVWYYCLESNFMTSEEQWTENRVRWTVFTAEHSVLHYFNRAP